MKFIPAYLPAVGYLAALRNSDTLECCLHSHYEKQTYRNRCTIYGANGRLNLTVPVIHNSNGQRQTDLEMKIHYADNWQKNHWKSLEAAYRSSPYFEFYEDELSEVYQQNHQGLMEMNLAFIDLFYRWLDEPFSMSMAKEYTPLSKEEEQLLDAKSTPKEYPNYPQTFDNKHGFYFFAELCRPILQFRARSKTILESIDLVPPQGGNDREMIGIGLFDDIKRVDLHLHWTKYKINTQRKR